MRVFFDTNVLVYLFDAGSPRKQTQARELFERHALAGGAELIYTEDMQDGREFDRLRLRNPFR